MMRFSNLTMRNVWIAAHDALATTLAVFASFYLRFEGDHFTERLPLLLRILPYFIAFSVVICYVFHLTTTKWRFISLPDALNILRAATVLTVALLVLDYIFVAPNVKGTFFLGKITIVLYWFLEVFFLSALRFAYRYFRYTRVRHHARAEDASPTLLIGRSLPMLKFSCVQLKVARSSGSGRSACCRRRRPIAGSRSGIFPCWAGSTISRT